MVKLVQDIRVKIKVLIFHKAVISFRQQDIKHQR